MLRYPSIGACLSVLFPCPVHYTRSIPPRQQKPESLKRRSFCYLILLQAEGAYSKMQTADTEKEG